MGVSSAFNEVFMKPSCCCTGCADDVLLIWEEKQCNETMVPKVRSSENQVSQGIMRSNMSWKSAY